MGNKGAKQAKVEEEQPTNGKDPKTNGSTVKAPPPEPRDPHHHDHPVYGHFTRFFADSFNNTFGFEKMTDEEIKTAFDKIDSKHQGFLDKCEITDALREHGTSEKEIQHFIDNMEEEHLDFEEFSALCKGKAQQYTTDLSIAGYDITVPNLAKIHDIPLLGGLTGATHNLVKDMTFSLAGVAMGAAWGGLDDEHLKEKFDEINTCHSGKISGTELAKALRALKMTEADIKSIKDQVGDKGLDFNEFKHLVKHTTGGSTSIHDHPVAGHFTAFFADSFNGAFGFGAMTDEEIKAAFEKIDTKHQGFLDKGEIHHALQEHGKSEREIQRMIDNMEEEQMDFDEFKALCQGKAQEYTTDISIGGYDVTMPNLAKVHDIPLLGAFTQATHNLVGGLTKQSYGLMGTAFGAAFGNLDDAHLKEKFEEIDTEKIGKLNKKEIAAALRKLGLAEADIKGITAAIGDDLIDYDGFKKLCGHEDTPAAAPTTQDPPPDDAAADAAHHHDHPVYGHFTKFFADSFNNTFGFGKMTDEEIKVAFDKIDSKHQGFLDKCEITDALRDHGKSEKEIQHFIDNMEEEHLDFDEFSALCKGKAQQYTTDLSIAGYDITVPNLAKVHDIPLLGGLTGATHNLVRDMTFSLAGVAMGAAWGGLDDEHLKEKFDEINTCHSGKISGTELAKALRALKMTEADIKGIKDQVGDKGLDFNEFKHLVKHTTGGSTSIHDHPVAGHFTAFFADSFNGAFGFGAMTDEEIKAAFEKIDTKHQGFLDKGEIHHALQEHGKSEREIQRMIDNMEEEQMDFDEFKALCQGKAQEYTTDISIGGYDVTMPNLAKVHDIPLLGAFTQATHNLVGGLTKQSYGLMGTAFGAAFGNLDDAHLKEKFEEIDTEKIGKLNKKEIAAALRKLGLAEADIKGITAAIGDDLIDYDGFKKLCGH